MSDPSHNPTGSPAVNGDAVAPFTVGAGFDFADPNSPLAKYYFRVSHILAVFFVGLVFVVAAYFPLWHTDIWGHLKYGRWMVENRAIPEREPFSPWWDGRQPFTQFYTLTQLAMYAAYTAGDRLAGPAGGVEMLRAEHALLTAARLAVMLLAFVRLGRSWPLALFGGAVVILLDLSNLAVFRPQVFAQLFFAVLLLPLSRDMLSRRAWVLVPLLMAVWANSHGSFIVALGLLGLLAAGRAVEVFTEANSLRAVVADGQFRRLALLLILSALAVGLNPYGFSLYSRTLALSRHPSLASAISEWQPVAFSWGRGWHWLFLTSVAAAVGTQLTSRLTLSAGRLFVLLAFGIGVALQERFVIWWAMVVPWVLLPQWAEIAGRLKEKWAFPASVPSLRKTILAGVLAMSLFMYSVPAGWLTSGSPMPFDRAVSAGTPWKVARQLSADEPHYAELAEVLKTYPGGKFRGSILATPQQGEYLLWALAPGVPVTYSHIHLFPPDFWEELGVVGAGRPGWWDVLDKYGANLIVAEAEYAVTLRDELKKSKAWKIVVDETGDPAKPNPFNRQLVAVRVRPI